MHSAFFFTNFSAFLQIPECCASCCQHQQYEQYKNGIFRYALSITKDAHLAEDVLHDTFVKVIRYKDKFIDAYLTKDGETVEEAKARLKKENK